MDPTSECNICEDLRQTVRVGNMRQLQKAHRVVMANVGDGTITEVEYPNRQARHAIAKRLFDDAQDPFPEQIEFSTLLTAEFLPDIVLHYFRCSACSLLFEFAVNTFHGSGGEWRPVFDEDLV